MAAQRLRSEIISHREVMKEHAEDVKTHSRSGEQHTAALAQHMKIGEQHAAAIAQHMKTRLQLDERTSADHARLREMTDRLFWLQENDDADSADGRPAGELVSGERGGRAAEGGHQRAAVGQCEPQPSSRNQNERATGADEQPGHKRAAPRSSSSSAHASVSGARGSDRESADAEAAQRAKARATGLNAPEPARSVTRGDGQAARVSARPDGPSNHLRSVEESARLGARHDAPTTLSSARRAPSGKRGVDAQMTSAISARPKPKPTALASRGLSTVAAAQKHEQALFEETMVLMPSPRKFLSNNSLPATMIQALKAARRREFAARSRDTLADLDWLVKLARARDYLICDAMEPVAPLPNNAPNLAHIAPPLCLGVFKQSKIDAFLAVLDDPKSGRLDVEAREDMEAYLYRHKAHQE